jgi:predicted metalloprotease
MWYGGITSYAARYMVLAHEIGHHVCGHTIGMMQDDPWGKELEADRYAGSAIKRAESLSFDQVVEAARETLPVAGSATHPPLELRVAAMRDGYASGSRCRALGIVKPRVISAEEQEEFRKSTTAFCTELLEELC